MLINKLMLENSYDVDNQLRLNQMLKDVKHHNQTINEYFESVERLNKVANEWFPIKEQMEMSQYLNFFIRTGENQYQQIANYSRNHVIYRTFDSAPYEQIRRLTESKIVNAIENLVMARDSYQKVMRDNDEQVAIQYRLCSKDEFLDIYGQIQQTNKELRQDIEECNNGILELQFIQRMTRTPNDAVIYFGVEIYDPEDEDII